MKMKSAETVRRLIITLVLLFLTSVLWKPAAASTGLGVEVQSFTLDNGMLFLLVERDSTPQVAFRLAIRAGSALEESGKTGIAHMLEHMLFKGTRNFGTLDQERDRELQQKIEQAYQVVLQEQSKRDPDLELIREKLEEMARLRMEVQGIYLPQAFSMHLGKNGAVGVNAFTSKDQTQYVMSLPSDMLELWFSMVSEQVFEPAFREFYVEKEVVKREWEHRYVNSPFGAGWLALHASMHTAHPYRNPTIGWKSDIDRFSTSDAEAFHRKFYNPENAVAVLVGDVKLEEVKRLAEIYFARYPAGQRASERVTQDEPQAGPRRVVRFLDGALTPFVLLGHHGASMRTEDFYALDVLTMVLSHGNGARMTRNIVRQGLAVSAWAHNPDNRYGGTVILGGVPNDPESLRQEGLDDQTRREKYLEACRELEALLLAEVERLEKEPVTSRELERIRKLARLDFLQRLRSNEDLAGTLATMEVQIGWSYLEDYLERIGEVTPDDIKRVAGKYINDNNRTTCYVIPGGERPAPYEPYEEDRSFSASVADSAGAPDDLSNHSKYPTPKGWRHPLSFKREPSRITYPYAETAEVRGAQVFYLPDRELPLVDLTILVKAGTVDVPEEKAGLDKLLSSSLIQGGSETYGPDELAALLDEHAIQVSFSVNEEDTVIRLTVMREDWETAVEILEEILTRPRFDSRVLEASRASILTGLSRQAGSAAVVSRRELEIRHFLNHPYGRDPLKSLETMPEIDREDLYSFLNEFMVPSNMVAAVSGDLSSEEAMAGLESLLGTMKDRVSPPKRRLPDPEPTPPVLAFIHKPGQVQSHVAIAMPGPLRTDADYWKTNILVSILGGRDSLVFRRLREDLGLVYSAYFHQLFKWKAGWIVGFIGCRGDSTSEAIKETLNIINDLRREIPENELERRRLDALNSFVFNVDNAAALTEVYARYHLRGEPLDTLDRIQSSYMEASSEDLARLARTYLDPAGLQIVVVGDRSTPVTLEEGDRVNLEASLRHTADALGIPFEILPLR